MVSTELARTIIGIIGNVISFGLFASPAPTFWRIIKNKSSEEFHPYPYLACVMNCLFWIFYGLPIVHPDSTLVITINSVGLFLELVYLTIFFIYTHKQYRLTIMFFLLGELALLAVVVVITLLPFHTHEKRSMFVGIICVIFGIIMYGSPLSIMKQVIQTKSNEFMPFWLSVAAFSNGLVWLIYALLKFDPYILTGNGIGALLGFSQLVLYCYYRKPKGSDTKPSEVQLQTATNKSPV